MPMNTGLAGIFKKFRGDNLTQAQLSPARYGNKNVGL